MSEPKRPYTRLQKIEAHQIAIQTALSSMAMMGREVPRNPEELLKLANEIADQSRKLAKQCKKYAREMHVQANA